ncbi:MAG: class I SAM-dependent methyltransferase [Phycisphaerales bacterium]
MVHPAFWRRVMLGGSLGAAESWIRGEWTSPDIAAVLRLFVRDIVRLDGLDRGGRLGAAAARVWHRFRPNTRRGSRRNIHAHYDLGNDLFELFLDPSMTYSSGIFDAPDASLEDAQIEKLDRICRKLELGPNDHVLEIGTGWGSFALHAAGRYGCRVTTTTISQEQHDRAAERFRRAGVDHLIDLRMQDYRDLEGSFDAVVSIEMIEAVGHAFLPEYFGTIGRRLRPGGRACIQAITMPNHRYAAYRKQADFIQRYIFPGSCCPSVEAMTAAMGRTSDLRIADMEDIGVHYAETLKQWRNRFDARIESVHDAGYDERFARLWRFYLAYCEAGFAERYIGTVQMVLERTGHGGTRASAMDRRRPGSPVWAEDGPSQPAAGPNPNAATVR